MIEHEQSQMNLYVKSSLNQIISQQGYADLIKAAWILVDIIARHPQLDFLDSDIRYEVVQLTQVGGFQGPVIQINVG